MWLLPFAVTRKLNVSLRSRSGIFTSDPIWVPGSATVGKLYSYTERVWAAHRIFAQIPVSPKYSVWLPDAGGLALHCRISAGEPVLTPLAPSQYHVVSILISAFDPQSIEAASVLWVPQSAESPSAEIAPTPAFTQLSVDSDPRELLTVSGALPLRFVSATPFSASWTISVSTWDAVALTSTETRAVSVPPLPSSIV